MIKTKLKPPIVTKDNTKINFNKMKKTILLIIIFAAISCNAQRTISLEQAYEYDMSDEGFPDDIAYIKDVNNRLDQFVGIWKGNYGGKQYEFRFEKKIKFGEYSIKRDQIIGRAFIKNPNNQIIYNTINTPDNKTYFSGINMQKTTYMLDFVANDACNDFGVVFIEISKNNPNIMYLNFDRDKTWYDPRKCPNFDSYVPLLPKEKMTLTKQ